MAGGQRITSLLDFLPHGVLLADGAMGTMLHARDVAFDRCFDELNLTQPAAVADIHRAYIDAGAQLIESNSFGANRFKLTQHGLEDSVAEINAAAIVLARRAVAASYKEVFIAGSVGPLGVRLAPYGRVKPAEACAAFREQVFALVEAGADLIVFETFSDLREMAEAVRAAREVNPAVPLVAMLTFTRDDHTLLGDEAGPVAAELARMGAEVIGVNCSGGPAQVLRLLQAMTAAAPGAHFAAMPNAGFPERVGGRIMYGATPAYFAEYALAFASAGARLIGGCCGTTPQHVAAMRAALDHPAGRRPERGAVFAAAERDERVAPLDRPTLLAEKLAAGRFVVAVEMDPPKGFGAEKLLAGASLLAEAGADVVDVADNPMARMRMSAWAVSYLIQREIGVESVLHFPTRGRNLLRVQGDLLAAHALGVRNIFVVLGDPTAIGDYPEAMDNYDIAPSGLIHLIKHGFNAGVDQAGEAIGRPTTFFAGCALNLGATDPEREMRVLRRKVAAGADFALTQPVYDPSTARAFLERYQSRYGTLDLPILVGVLPLYSARHARYLHNEAPGISIPQPLRQRMERAGDDSPAQGVRIARELLLELREMRPIHGMYLMPPFGRFEMAAEIIDAVREERGSQTRSSAIWMVGKTGG